MFQRHLSTALLFLYTTFSLLCLIFRVDPVVRSLKTTFSYLMSPVSTPLLSEMDGWGAFGRNMSRLLKLDLKYIDLRNQYRQDQLDRKRLDELARENARLLRLLGLRPDPGFETLVARPLAGDASTLFHSLLISRGKADGVRVSDPVVALESGREVLVGRVSDVFSNTARVVLLTDALSEVSAKIDRINEKGVVQGQGTNTLIMNYLLSDSEAQAGDEVTTAALGGVFPPGIFIGTVKKVEQTSRESFKKVYLIPALHLTRLDEVSILRRKAPEAAP